MGVEALGLGRSNVHQDTGQGKVRDVVSGAFDPPHPPRRRRDGLRLRNVLEHRPDPMTVYTDDLARRIFGETTDQALADGHCLRCKLPMNLAALSPRDRRDYNISAICPVCWVALFPEDDPKVEHIQ